MRDAPLRQTQPFHTKTPVERATERAEAEERKRKSKPADAVKGSCGDPDAAYGTAGYCFSCRQDSMKSGGTWRMTVRRYWVMFKLDEHLQPVWTGGVKPTVGTMERMQRIDWTKGPAT